MTPLQAKIATSTIEELYIITNNLKRYAVNRNSNPDNVRIAVDTIIAINKRLHPYECFSDYAIYKAYGISHLYD